MNISICIIAKDEARSIGDLINQIHQQTVFSGVKAAELLIICNGCTDGTAEVAGETFSKLDWPANVKTAVHEFTEAGKARSWNEAVHNIISVDAEIAFFVDADVELIDTSVLRELLAELQKDNEAVAISGWPLKDIARKDKKTFIDSFSLKISAQTQYTHSINGSLYAAEMQCLKPIWLPVPIPGEDGMLSAMVQTKGFTTAPQKNLIIRAKRPTHYYEAHTIEGFFRHEQRMVIGTTINGWLFEHFWEGNHSSHVGEMVRELNNAKPGWISEIVAGKVGDRRWVLPRRLLTWRLNNLRAISLGEAMVRSPFSLGATLLNIYPCMMANRTLKKQAAASFW